MKPMSILNFQQGYVTTFASFKILLIIVVTTLLLGSCASSDITSSSASVVSGDANATACKINDTRIQDSSQCLQDDAACYQLSNGQWCTGQRGALCPAGSSEVAAGMSCPIGKRCFRISESL